MSGKRAASDWTRRFLVASLVLVVAFSLWLFLSNADQLFPGPRPAQSDLVRTWTSVRGYSTTCARATARFCAGRGRIPRTGASELARPTGSASGLASS